MIDPASGPFLFDTSAESYFGHTQLKPDQQWLSAYSMRSPMYVSVLTVLERMRGYTLATIRAEPAKRQLVEKDMSEYVESLGLPVPRVASLTTREALISAHLMALHPSPPSPPRRSHRGVESRQDRLSRWRFDIMIASTALIRDLPLIHNNPADFEPLRAVIERFPDRFPGVGPLNLISVRRLAA